MTTWMSIEVFDGKYAAQLWADAHIDTLIEAAISHGAFDWEVKKTAWGIAFEVAFESDKAWSTFHRSSTVADILDRTPDPRDGVLVYRGKSLDGGNGARRPKKPRSGAGGATLQLPFVTAPFVEPLAALFGDATTDRRALTRSR